MRSLVATIVALSVLFAGFSAASDVHAYADSHAGQSIDLEKEQGRGHVPENCDHCGHVGGHLTGMVSEPGTSMRRDGRDSPRLKGTVLHRQTDPPPTPPPNA